MHILAAIMLISISASAAPRTMKCQEYQSAMLAKSVRYCIDRSQPETPSVNGEAVVYFMHGSNGGAASWTHNNYEKSLADLRAMKVLPPTTFVSFDTSAYSFFADHPTKDPNDTSSAYESWFIKEFMPFIETTYGVCAKRSCRGIMGESMGGFGALKTALKYPDKFVAVAANSPALSPFTERGTNEDWKKYLDSAHISGIKKLIVYHLLTKVFRDEESFEANDPTTLLKHLPVDGPIPNIYFDMGGNDDYRFDIGYRLFAAAVVEKQTQMNFVSQTLLEPEGRHDMWRRHAGDAIEFLENQLSYQNFTK